jgi:hypothetical protein
VLDLAYVGQSMTTVLSENTLRGSNITKDESDSDIVAEARFLCAECGQKAGHIRLFGSPSEAKLWRDSFTSVLTSAVSAEHFPLIHLALEQGDVRALYAVDLEYTPFFCPQCEAVYCGSHWQKWPVFDSDFPGWFDSCRGRCPKGHERMLED